MTELWIFIGALAIAYLVPGPDMILLFQAGALQGRAHALATAVGLAAARAAHVALAGLGLATLLRTVPVAFEIARIFGAAYLIWLGISILRSPSVVARDSDRSVDRPRISYSSAVRRGYLTNLLNPKALLFCSVLLPQFVLPENGGLGLQFLSLGAILVGIGILFDVIYASTGSTLGRWAGRHRMVEKLQRWSLGVSLIGFGTRLAIAGRFA